MTEDPERQREYDAALADAVDHVSHALEAQQEGKGRVRRRWLPGLTVSLVAFVLVAAWNVWLVVRPASMLPEAAIENGLRYEVGLLAQEVEAYRLENGRLPRPDEIAPMLDEVVGYTLVDDGYVITAHSGPVSLVYDGSVPAEDWMASR